MNKKSSKPFGLWPSPVTPASLAQGIRLSDVQWDDDGEQLVWLEGRSDRGVLVCAPLGQAPRDLTPTRSVRARVGYGGGDFSVGGEHVYYVAQEGRIYRQPLAGGEAHPITPQFGHMASPTLSPDGRWLLFIHTYERIDGLDIVDASGQRWPQKLVYGDDFYMNPCWHPGGARIAWISWNHPNMPWDGTMLKTAAVETGGTQMPVTVESETLAAEPDVSVLQPRFSPDGRSLAYLSDKGGWSNLWLYDLKAQTHRRLTDLQVQIGRTAWAQGIRSYGFSADGGQIYFLCSKQGFGHLWVCDLETGLTQEVDSPLRAYTDLQQIAISPQDQVALVASSGTVSDRVVSLAASGEGAIRVHRRSSGENIPADEQAAPQPVRWTAGDGTTVHGLYYAPASTRFAGTGLPPAIISIHGGPTGQSTAFHNTRAQFFATRGYAFLEVNYRGSTGYGKPYMALLRGKWGLLDVEDAVGGAQYLVDAGLADRDRLVIMGGSAGGYTVLKALVDHPGFFCAALCLYGVSNMFTLAADTHKFEERYLDSMLGPLPEAASIYRERSPIFYADRIVDPIAVFQGEIDRVVPRAQADEIVASLRQRGVPHEYHLYEGEGHGWRKRETIEAFWKTVEAFLRQYVIFA